MTRMEIGERRERLIDAALTVVKRNGVGKASVRAVVAEAGMPLGAFHYAFTSQDALLGAVIERVTDMDRIAAQAALEGPQDAVTAHGDPAALAAMIEAGINGFVDHLVADPYSELAFLELVLHGTRQDLDDRVGRDRYSVTYGTPEFLLARAASASGRAWTVPLRQAARLLVGALDGLTIAWLADHDTDAARATAAFHAQALARLTTPLKES